jgi:hypothetical protein
MSFCKIAIIGISFVWGSAVVMAAPAPAPGAGVIELADRALLADYARDTWRSIEALSERGALPADSLRRNESGWVVEGLTSPTNVAAYLWSTIAAEDLHLISSEESGRRVGQTLSSLAQLERSHGFFYNWYEPSTGARARVWPGGGVFRPFLSVVDNGWLAAALIVVGNTRPEHRAAADAILQTMDFGFFYDPFDPADPIGHPGLLRGGYWPDDNTYAGFHYGALNTEPRIASYVGIARGQVPPEHYYRMFRTSQAPLPNPPLGVNTYAGVPVSEGTLSYRGIQFVPSWDGTMFEALMVSLLVPEADWAPRSWGANHPLYVRAQIEYGLRDAQLGFWGLSAACTPGGGYTAYGVAALGVRTHGEQGTRPREGIIAPYASFLALPFAPAETLANLRSMSEKFPVYGAFGFHDSVNVLTGQVSDRVLILDQGMILAALSNAIGSDVLRRGFCVGPVEATIRPLIAQESFDTRMDSPSNLIKETVDDREESDALGLLPPQPVERSIVSGHPRYGKQHLFEGILTAAGVAVIACRVRVSKGHRTSTVPSSLD